MIMRWCTDLVFLVLVLLALESRICLSLKTYETGKAGVWFLVFVITVFIMGLVHVDRMSYIRIHSRVFCETSDTSSRVYIVT